MQLDQLKKDIGYRVQLIPEACRLDQNGSELPDHPIVAKRSHLDL